VTDYVSFQVSSGPAGEAADDFPYLAKVELTLTSHFPRVVKSCVGHLDHMGMHGVIIPGNSTGDANFKGGSYPPTFALMPVKEDTKKPRRGMAFCAPRTRQVEEDS
jgi:hypothetical protein